MTSRLLLPLFIISLSLKAQISTDGTLGSAINLPGPDYQISSDLGYQLGNHLYHSFQEFNLQSHERATFSGQNTIENVISRVTGGKPSQINGLMRSTLPNADMYFLNPNGIIFGPHARLDVQGSFHASTADYLRLSDGGRFDARHPSASILSIAPIESFGFLTDSPAPLSIENSELTLSDGNTFSLISGDITIKNGQLFAPNGRFNLISLAQQGEVDIQSIDFIEKQGTIHLSDQSNINVNGIASGEIMIRGGQLLIDNSKIQANTLGEQKGQGITMTLNERIEINGPSAEILSQTLGNADAGSIKINTPYLLIIEGRLLTNSLNEGRAGNIQINTLETSIQEGGKISSDSFNQGQGGNIMLIATKKLSIADQRIFLEAESAKLLSQLSSTSIAEGEGGHIMIETGELILDGGYINSNTHKQSNGGHIVIEADSVEMKSGGMVAAGVLSQSSGIGGNIRFNVKEKMNINGFRPGFTATTTDLFENLASGIVAVTFGASAAGKIKISAKELALENQGMIAAATGGEGNAGDITIEVGDLYLKGGGLIANGSGATVNGQLVIGRGASGTIKITAHESLIATGYSHFSQSGIFSNTLGSAQGGHIQIDTQHLKLSDGALFSTNSIGMGDAGDMSIYADTITLTKKAEMTSSSAQASGGRVTLLASNLLYLQDGQITTSVQGGTGDGGNITITHPTFVVINQGKIIAQANEGDGGNIHIASKHFIGSPDSLISASSKLGLDGNVQIDSPDVDIEGFLVVLPEGYIEAELKNCTSEEINNLSTFKIKLSRKRNLPFGK
jgi:filamentous hemagglutinin family protein